MFSKRIKVIGLVTISSLLPICAFAFSATNLSSFINGIISGVINPLGAVLVSLAVIYFIVNTITFIRADDKKREDARKAMIYGIIALTVMVSFWGLIMILQSTFKLDNSTRVRDQIKGVYDGTSINLSF